MDNINKPAAISVAATATVCIAVTTLLVLLGGVAWWLWATERSTEWDTLRPLIVSGFIVWGVALSMLVLGFMAFRLLIKDKVDDFLLDGNTPLGEEAMDANSQLLIALTTDNEQESQGWKPDGLLYQDFLVMLRVYLGWRFKAKITLTTRTRLLAAPPLGEGPFWLGMNGVLGAEDEGLPEDIPHTFTTELGYYTGLQPATPQQGNRRVTYKFN